PVAVDAVRDDARPGAEHQDGQELGRGHQPERDAAPREVEDQPGDGHGLHPRAGLADELAAEEQAEVPAGERTEGGVTGEAESLAQDGAAPTPASSSRASMASCSRRTASGPSS